ncbi:hypothetical protein [Amycolatopsis sp. NPDC049868]
MLIERVVARAKITTRTRIEISWADMTVLLDGGSPLASGRVD